MADTFFPPLSSIIATDQIPDNLSFVTDTLYALLDRICFRDLQIQRTLKNTSVSYNLDLIIFNEALRLEFQVQG